MRNIHGIWGFWPVRLLDQILSVPALFRFLSFLAGLRAGINTTFGRTASPRIVPGCFGQVGQVRLGKRHRQADYLNRVFELIPDRLGTAKWRGCCQINGLENLRVAHRSGKPVVLTFCHFGPYVLLRFWLRAAGIPVSTMVKGRPENRSLLRRLQDRYSPFPELPTAFYQERLADALESLRAGNPLLIAVDVKSGKQIDVSVDEEWNFRMATGAIRLAIAHEAELIPCILIDEGSWRFRFEIGAPVPNEFLIKGADWSLAGKHVIDHLFRQMRTHPEQCSRQLLACFSRKIQVESISNAKIDSRQPVAE